MQPTSAALHYPAEKKPATWGKNGELNRELLLRIARSCRRITQEFGAQIKMGGDFNIYISDDLQPEDKSAAGRRALGYKRQIFILQTKHDLNQWLNAMKNGDDEWDAIIEKRKEAVSNLNLKECVMAQIQKKFRQQLELNFPHVYDDQRPFNVTCREHLPLDGEIDGYLDQRVPEFQIKPTTPLQAIEAVHEITDYAAELTKDLSLQVTPETQHFHVSVLKDNENLTQYACELAPGTAYGQLLQRLQSNISAVLPILFDSTLPINHAFQNVRVTLNKVAWRYEPTIRAMEDHFEYRCANSDIPHAALHVALICESILQGLQAIAKTNADNSELAVHMRERTLPLYWSHNALLSRMLITDKSEIRDFEAIIHTPKEQRTRMHHEVWNFLHRTDLELFGYYYHPPLTWQFVKQAERDGDGNITFPKLMDYRGSRVDIENNHKEKLRVRQAPPIDFANPNFGCYLKFPQYADMLENAEQLQMQRIISKLPKNWMLNDIPEMTAYNKAAIESPMRRMFGQELGKGLADAHFSTYSSLKTAVASR